MHVRTFSPPPPDESQNLPDLCRFSLCSMMMNNYYTPVPSHQEDNTIITRSSTASSSSSPYAAPAWRPPPILSPPPRQRRRRRLKSPILSTPQLPMTGSTGRTSTRLGDPTFWSLKGRRNSSAKSTETYSLCEN